MDAVYAASASCLPEDRRNEARNIIEAISNLLYLIQLDSKNPGLVQSYTSQAEERLGVLAGLMDEPLQRMEGKPSNVVPISASVHV